MNADRFYRVQKRDDNTDFVDFATSIDARKYCEQKKLTEKSHVLFEMTRRRKGHVSLEFNSERMDRVIIKPEGNPNETYAVGAIGYARK